MSTITRTTYSEEEKAALEQHQDKAINIQFHSGYTDTGYTGKKYTYKHDLSNVAVGDLVVIKTSGQYKIVRVSDVAVPVTQPDSWYKWIVCKFNICIRESPGG